MQKLAMLLVLGLATGAWACGCEDRIAAIEAVVNTLGRASCQTGSFRINNCEERFEDNVNDVIQCVTGPLNGDPETIKTENVVFSETFPTPPVVTIGLSGAALAQGLNQSAVVTSVTESGFSVTYEADDFIAVQSDFNWFACPSPAIPANRADLGPAADGSDSCCSDDSSGGDSRRR